MLSERGAEIFHRTIFTKAYHITFVLVRSLIRSLVRSFVHSFVRSFVRSLVGSFVCLFIYLFIYLTFSPIVVKALWLWELDRCKCK